MGVPAVQRKEVEVSGGVFKDDCGDGYVPYNVDGEKLDEHGAQMSQLEFRPARNVPNKSGEPAKEVSLVQTTNSTVKQKGQVGEVEDQPESMLNERRTEGGTAIDQQIFLRPGDKTQKFDLQVGQLKPLVEAMAGRGKQEETNAKINAFLQLIQTDDYQSINDSRQGILASKLDMILKAEKGDPADEVRDIVPKAKKVVNNSRRKVNLDPRYAEERKSSEGKRKKSEASGTKAQGTTGWSATRASAQEDWTGAAVLRDRPAHTVKKGTELEGQEEFEVVAMADGDKFVGSIKWGWKIDGTKAELLHPEIVKASEGDATEELYEAAKKWNEMKVKDLDARTELSPMQLPTKD